MIEGVFDRVDTNGKVGLAVSSGRVSVGPEDDVVSAGWLNETELPGNETPEIELIAKEETVGKLKEIELLDKGIWKIELLVKENVGKLPLSSSVVLSDRLVRILNPVRTKSAKSNEVALRSDLEKLVD